MSEPVALTEPVSKLLALARDYPLTVWRVLAHPRALLTNSASPRPAMPPLTFLMSTGGVIALAGALAGLPSIEEGMMPELPGVLDNLAKGWGKLPQHEEIVLAFTYGAWAILPWLLVRVFQASRWSAAAQDSQNATLSSSGRALRCTVLYILAAALAWTPAGYWRWRHGGYSGRHSREPERVRHQRPLPGATPRVCENSFSWSGLLRPAYAAESVVRGWGRGDYPLVG